MARNTTQAINHALTSKYDVGELSWLECWVLNEAVAEHRRKIAKNYAQAKTRECKNAHRKQWKCIIAFDNRMNAAYEKVMKEYKK